MSNRQSTLGTLARNRNARATRMAMKALDAANGQPVLVTMYTDTTVRLVRKLRGCLFIIEEDGRQRAVHINSVLEFRS